MLNENNITASLNGFDDSFETASEMKKKIRLKENEKQIANIQADQANASQGKTYAEGSIMDKAVKKQTALKRLAARKAKFDEMVASGKIIKGEDGKWKMSSNYIDEFSDENYFGWFDEVGKLFKKPTQSNSAAASALAQLNMQRRPKNTSTGQSNVNNNASINLWRAKMASKGYKFNNYNSYEEQVAAPSVPTTAVPVLDEYKETFDAIRNFESQIIKIEAEIALGKVMIQNTKKNDGDENLNVSVQRATLKSLREKRQALRKKQIDLIKKAVSIKKKMVASGFSENEFEDMYEDMYGEDNSFLGVEFNFLDVVDFMEEQAFEDSFAGEDKMTPTKAKSQLRHLLDVEREIVIGLRKVASINEHVAEINKQISGLEEGSKEANQLKDKISQLELKKNASQNIVNKKVKSEAMIIDKLSKLKNIAYHADPILNEFDDSISMNNYEESFDGIFGLGLTKEQKEANFKRKQYERERKFDLKMQSRQNAEDAKRGLTVQDRRNQIEADKAERKYKLYNPDGSSTSVPKELLPAEPVNTSAVIAPIGDPNAGRKSPSKNTIKIFGKEVAKTTVFIGSAAMVAIIVVVVLLIAKKK